MGQTCSLQAVFQALAVVLLQFISGHHQAEIPQIHLAGLVCLPAVEHLLDVAPGLGEIFGGPVMDESPEPVAAVGPYYAHHLGRIGHGQGPFWISEGNLFDVFKRIDTAVDPGARPRRAVPGAARRKGQHGAEQCQSYCLTKYPHYIYLIILCIDTILFSKIKREGPMKEIKTEVFLYLFLWIFQMIWKEVRI